MLTSLVAAQSDDSNSPRLPQELIDYILDNLDGNNRILKQCCLVCKAWLPRSSQTLFSTFLWPSCRHAWDRLYTHPRPMRCKCVRDLADYDNLLEVLSASTRIRLMVQCLKLNPIRFHPEGTYTYKMMDFRTFPLIINLLPRLRLLEFHDWHGWTDPFPEVLPTLPAGTVCAISEIRFNGCRHYIPDASDVLSMFSHVHRLSLGCYESTPPEPLELIEPTRQPGNGLHITCIEFGEQNSPDSWFPWLQRNADLSSLRQVVFHRLVDYDKMRGFLASATSVCSLAYVMHRHETGNKQTVSPIPPTHAIASVRIRYTCQLSATQPKTSLALARHLRDILAPSLRTLTIAIEVHAYVWWHGDPIDTLFNRLSAWFLCQEWGVFRGCSSLRELHIKLRLLRSGGSGVERFVQNKGRSARVVEQAIAQFLEDWAKAVLRVSVEEYNEY